MKQFFWALVVLNAVLLLLFGVETASALARTGTVTDPDMPVLTAISLTNCVFFFAAVWTWRRWRALTEVLANAAALLANLAQAYFVVVYTWEIQVIDDLVNNLIRQPEGISPDTILFVLLGAAFTIPNFVGLRLRRTAFADRQASGETPEAGTEPI